MKCMRYVAALICAVFLFSGQTKGQTTLAAGDLVFVGYNCAGTEDEFSFVLLAPVSAGTQIRFTDFGWRSDAAAFQTANPCGATTGAVSDGAITWTTSSALPCGTQVSIQCQAALTASTGTVTGLQATFNFPSQYMNLATGGESIFAFQGTLGSPTLLSALNMNGGWDATLTNCEFTSSKSILPAALASHNLVKSPETDNARYDCSTVSALPANLRTAIYNNTNWTGTDGALNVYTLPLSCTFSCNACTAPSVTGNPPNRTICAGNNTTFGITATGTGLTYQWQENSGSGFANITASSTYVNVTTNTLTINGVTAGMTGNLYRCVVTGTCGSATSNNGTLTVSSISTATGSQTNVSCFGGSNGTATVAPSGGISPYTYSWAPSGGTGATATGLSANTYTVTVTDNIGCQATRNYTITQPAAAVSGSTVVTNVACFGGSTGAIDLTPSGGTPGYTYNWGSGVTTQDRTGLIAGSYSVTITDANGCSGIVNASVTQPVAAVSGSTVVTNVACFGGSTGAINLTPSGGTSPYTFNWGGGITTEDRTGLAAGGYSVTITDANGCTGTVSPTVTQPASAVSGSTVVTNVACFGGSNGAIDLTPSGGTPGYTYNWGGGVTTQDRTGLASGGYAVTITDGNGCTGVVNATVTQPAAAVSGSTVITNVACNAGTNGAINLTPSGGTSPYTFNWGGGITTEDRTGLAAGSYSVTITDANSCTGTVNVSVTQPSASVSGSTVVTNVACFGGTNGAINLTPSGGTSPYTFDWGGGITTEDRTGLAAGGYSVTITDANGCTGTVNATVTQPSAAVSGSTVVTNVACFGGSTGAINLTPSGGTSPYTFDWGGGITTEDRTSLAAGGYSVTITDANSCTGTVNATVTQPASAISTATGSQTDATCGLSDGDASVTPSGGTAPYTYSWSPGGATTSSISGLAAGSYTVTVTDANGCTATRNYTINSITTLSTAIGSQTNVACNGAATGAASVSPTGGVAPYTYSWSPGGATTSSISGLVAGTYTVTVTDANGCPSVRNFTITQPSAISTAIFTQTNVACNGASTGLASITPSGGTPSYTYSWSPGGATTPTIGSLAAGTYTVTVTDANSCTATRIYNITQPSAISTATGSQSDATCNGGNDGAASVSPSGGTPPYTYSWSPSGGTAATATGLVAGTYTVTVEDANGCTATRNYTIGQPSVISTATGSQTNVSCNGGSNGTATVTPSGGTAPYTYSWSPSGGTAATATGLAAGSYTVTVTDDNGCTATRIFTITQPSVINTATGSQTNLLCNGAITGSASITPSGGTAPYTYSWSPSGGTAATATGLAAGTYTVTVTDANGCVATRNYTLTQPSAINTATGSQTNATCAAPNGSASITPSGGTAPYTYSWSPSGGTGSTATGLAAGVYTVTVTDANNCTATRIYTITDPGAINTSVGSQTNVSCNGGSNGTASITPSGGTAPYTYSWAPSGGTGATASGLTAGTYTVTVTDANGCSATRNYTLTEPTAISTATGSQTNVLCNGAATGSATISPSGGIAPYTYSWAPSGGTAATATGLAAGAYLVVVTDDNGCQASRIFTITEPSAINTTTGAQTNILCNGAATGSASITPSGGTAPYTYSWSPSGGTASSASGLTAGTYTVTVTDANGCTATRNYTITQPAAISTATGSQTNVSCNGGSNGTASVTPSGGTAPYTYSWAPSGGTGATATGLAAGSYTVTVTDANGCTATRNYTITQPAAISTATGSQTNVSCNGGSNGTASVTPSGGTAPYTYSWAPSGGTGATATGLAAGSYTVTVTDANGCITTRNYTITQPPALSTTGSQTNVLCNGGSTGAATVTPSGGTAPYTYSWAPSGGTAATATGLAVGTYTVTVTDANSCQVTRNFTITQPPAINTATGSQTNVACNGAATGSASITPSGGTPPYTYSWAPSGGTAATASGLAAGAYTVTVTDANGCTATRNYTITQPAAINTATGSQTNVSCNGGSNGTASITPSGGVAPYSYSWSPGGATTQAITGLSAGSYTVTVTDDNGCTAARIYTITEPAAIAVYNVTGGGAYCTGGAGVAVGLSNSETGVDYQLFNGVSTVGSAVAGTGSAISFGNQTAIGTYTVVATNTTTSCQETMAGSATISINPTPDVNAVSSQTLCNGATTSAVSFSGSVVGTTFSWTNNTTSIGLAASGTGNIGAFTATNTGTAPATATITVTPTATGCTGATETFTITVNPTPTVNSVSNQTLCNGATTTAVNFSGAVSGTAYSWTNNTTSIGLGASGTGNIAAFTATNTGTAPVAATIMVTPSANGCTGTAQTFNITVNPTPVVNTVSNQTVCNGTTTTAVNFSGAVTGTSYSWTNSNTAIGLGANGTGNIAAFTATNTGSTIISGTVTVTPSANGCTGTAKTFTIAVNPTPVVNTVANQTLCNGASTTAVSFSGAVAGTTYAWTNNTTSIGLAANGTGNIASFVATNSTSAPVTATITVTPSANGCTGSFKNFTITVNPTPVVNTIANQTLCNGASTTAVSFSGAVTGTTYSWTNNTTSIGLAANGTGNIASFTATNSTSAPITATITVTPSANGCTGTAKTFTITVNPTPVVNTVANQTLCNGASTTAVSFSGAVAGTTYTWTNNTASIGLAASGTGNIASFVATNSASAPITATITVTPSANACTGSSKNFTITVNPTPVVNTIANQTLCNGASTTAVSFSGAVTGTTYSWTNNTTSIGLAANGTGNIASFTATNTTSAPVTATIIVTPSANGCTGSTKTFTITVNPTPSVNTVADQSVCNAAPTTAVNFAGPVSGTTYAWTNNATSIGLAANGTGSIASFAATNTTNAPVTATITVTPSANGCTGPSKTFNITVNPTPGVDAISNQVLCNGASTASVNFTGAVSGSGFIWVNTAPSIGLAATGVGNIASFIATNTTNAPVIATITVTPSANSCTGPAKNFTITVNPTPTVDAIADKVVCNGGTVAAVAPAGPVTGTTFAWVNTDPSIGLAANGSSNIPAFAAVNTTANPVIATVTITPTANGCVGIQNSYDITVNPTPMLSSTLTPPAICDSAQFSYTPTSATAGTAFAWSRVAVAGIANAAASGTNNPNEALVNTTPNPVTVTYVYTLTANACPNTQNVTVTVNPTPKLSTPLTDSVCSEGLFTYTPVSATSGTNFAWVRAAVGGITPATGSGTGNISETLVNSTSAGINVNYVYTLTANGCVNTQTLAVMVNSKPAIPEISIMPPTTLCDNTMYQNFGTLSPAANGASYTWTADNAIVWASGANNENCIVNFTEPGTAVITLTSSYPASGCTSSASFTATVGSDVSDEPQVIYYNGRFVCLLNNADSYRWGYDDKSTLDSNIISGQTNQDYFNTTPDLVNRYYWVMTTKDGCMQKSYYNKPTGIHTIASENMLVKLYPNPAVDKVNIELSEFNTIHASVKLFDVTGKNLKSANVSGVKTQLDVSDLTQGIYFIGYYENGVRLATLRFIKN